MLKKRINKYERHFKNLWFVLLVIFVVFAIIIDLHLKFANPDMTSTRLFITYWQWYTCEIIAIVGLYFFLSMWNKKNSTMKDFSLILETAMEKGKAAMTACKPTPQHFYPADLSGKALGPGTIESEGDCGGAYIRAIQYNSEIYKFFKTKAKSNGMTGANADFKLPNGIHLRKDVYKGYTLHFPTYNFYNGQSHERYKAFYEAAAEVLKAEGVSCSVRDYLT